MRQWVETVDLIFRVGIISGEKDNNGGHNDKTTKGVFQMKPRKLKELLVFAIVHKSPELLPIGKKEQLEDGLMKLTAEELETLEDFISRLGEQSKPMARRRRGVAVEVGEEEDGEVTLEDEEQPQAV